MKLDNISKKYKKRRKFSRYAKYQKLPLEEKTFLLEAGQGLHINGNVFAFVHALETDSKWYGYKWHVVVTTSAKKAAEKKLADNGFSQAKLVIRDSDEYTRLLATAKYLVTDNSFPSYYVKREGQVCLNTWHGTPLKRLGRQDIEHSTSIGNVQKNFLFSDYLLFPNTYTRDIMMEDYMVSRLYRGKSVLIDYPRNDALFDTERSKQIREKYGLEDKKVLAYMPTWRGTGRNANVQKQVEDIEQILGFIDEKLHEDEILFVNLHFLVTKGIDFKQYKNIRKFPAEYETYVFLAACDVLISDYSSVMIDFAQTGRDVIMYMYDYEEYCREKGFYFDVRTLPFKQAETEDELMEAIHGEPRTYKLDDSLVGENFGHATKKMLELLCNGVEEGINVEQWQPGEDIRVIHAGNILRPEDQFILNRFMEGMPEEEKKRTVLTFENRLNGESLSYLGTIDPALHFVRYIITDYRPFSKKVYEVQERKRLMYGIEPASMEFLQSGNARLSRMISRYKGRKVYHNIPSELRSALNYGFAKNPASYEKFISRFDEIKEYPPDFCNDMWKEQEPMSWGIIADFDCEQFMADDEKLFMSGTLDVRFLEKDFQLKDSLLINSKEYKINLKLLSESFANRVYKKTAHIELTVDPQELVAWNVNNRMAIGVSSEGKELWARVRSAKKQTQSRKIYKIPSIGSVCSFKPESLSFRIVVREENVTDKTIEKIKLVLAFALSRMTPWYKPVLLYEKNCARYEESASVLLEYLADIHYKSARFVLDKNYEHKDGIPEKCRKYIIDKYSFAHYYNLFAAKTLISSEAVGHALEKQTTSKLFKNYIDKGSKNYIFLQHGVMYMVSLGADKRFFFNVDVEHAKRRVVVSSNLEAEHFKHYTRYRDEDIYVCGLLKFDKSILYDNADRITVMLTWRPWEYVSGINDIRQTAYFKMLERIEAAVPEELKEKLIILPHPLIAKQMETMEASGISKYMIATEKYDEILRTTKLLITDYSSISYDAFYRGTNIIFDWEEKDMCMKEYGRGGKLMLTEDLAFGDVCMNSEQLAESIRCNYDAPQSEEYINRYRQIVEFHDGKNTERFVTMAKKDGLL